MKTVLLSLVALTFAQSAHAFELKCQATDGSSTLVVESLDKSLRYPKDGQKAVVYVTLLGEHEEVLEESRGISQTEDVMFDFKSSIASGTFFMDDMEQSVKVFSQRGKYACEMQD